MNLRQVMNGATLVIALASLAIGNPAGAVVAIFGRLLLSPFL